jgi:carbamoyl-phosphate synthase small subunit
MMGYPESFTDPSYRGQILTLTYPMIGNYGVSEMHFARTGLCENFESEKIHIRALVVSEFSRDYSHYSAKKSLQEWLFENEIPAVYGIDTRALTKKLREHGVMLGKIQIGNGKTDFYDPNKINIVEEVSCKQPIVYGSGRKKIALLDTGAKHNIIAELLKRDTTVIRFPWGYDIFNGKYKFNGVFLSNGPGDPKMCKATIETTKKAMEYNLPTFGICLGNQILGLAAGADTYKLKYGHRSQNQPCGVVGTNRCYITSQNHGFAVNEKTLPAGWKPWFRNLNDGTNEGIRHERKPFMSVQFHPESMPGPIDTTFLFDKFLEMI